MRQSLIGGSFFRAAALLSAFTFSALLGGSSAKGEEAYERFLEGLKEQGLYDIALEYVRSMKDSPLLSNDQRLQLPLEEGQLLVESAQAERDTTTKFKQLDQARERFESFIKANASHPLAAQAASELGNVLVVRGRSLLDQAKRPANASKKDQLIKDARDLMTQAQTVFNDSEKKFDEEEKKFPRFIDPKDVKQIDARKIARANVLRSSLLSGAVLFDLAKTHPDGSKEQHTLLQQAADKYASVYEKHRKLLAGLLARVKEGECYQSMGDTKRALGLYESILTQPDDEAFRKLKNSTLHLAMQCMVADTEKKYDIAIDKGQKWLASAHPSDERAPDGLGIRYFLAVAEKKLADSLQKPEEQARKKAALTEARKQAGLVKKFPGAYQEEANKLYAGISPAAEGDENKEPANFVEARDRGKDLLEQWQTKLQAIKMAPVTKEEANIPKYQQEAGELRAKALQYFRLAMELRDEETHIDDVNIVRYYLCFLAYNSGDYYDAAVLGEFLARNYPESSGGRQCAKIAMSAYQQGYLSPQAIEKEFDKQKMVDIADYITRRWAGQEEADEAWTTLMSIAVNEHQLDQASQYLDKIAADSPRRGNAELRLGQALWAAYLTSGRKEEADRPPQAELDAMVAKAKTTLEDGIKRMRVAVDSGADVVSTTLAAAVLSLGQIYVDSGQAEKAVELLNDPKIGPLPLVAAGHPATKQGKYDIETYKLALRAYVATEALDKAEQAMNDLEKLAAANGDADTAGTLTKIYVALGRELQEQVTRLRQENKTEELAKVSKGFELFLERISARENGNDFRSLNWVADTFYNLGSGYDAGGAKQLTPEAKAYYEKSLKTDERLMADAKSKKDFVSDPNLLLGVKLRMARAYRRLGEFNKAIGLLSEILKEKLTLVEVQREAAHTLQDWGAQKPDFYNLAILGAKKYKKPDGQEEKLIWGWGTMAVKVQSDRKLADAFHEARYNLAKCRMEQARTKTEASEKSALLAKAEQDILFTSRVRPDLGGEDWRKKYDSLLKAIQQLQGKKPTGLPQEKTAATPDVVAPKAAPAVKPAVKPTVASGDAK